MSQLPPPVPTQEQIRRYGATLQWIAARLVEMPARHDALSEEERQLLVAQDDVRHEMIRLRQEMLNGQ